MKICYIIIDFQSNICLLYINIGAELCNCTPFIIYLLEFGSFFVDSEMEFLDFL